MDEAGAVDRPGAPSIAAHADGPAQTDSIDARSPRGRPADPWHLALAAWAISIIATLGSLRYSGVGFLGIEGLRLIPCELCWYQRILMYPLTAILAVAWWRRDALMAKLGLGIAVAGAAVAAYHSLIQILPHLERGQCIVGSCTGIYYRILGLTIPNQSLLAFLLIAGCLGGLVWARQRQ